MTKAISKTRLIVAMAALLLTAAAYGAAPGISAGTSGPVTFNLTAQAAFLNQPDGASVYSWGYGCAAGFSPAFLPAAIPTPDGGCPSMQVPGPTLIVTQGQVVTVKLTNALPTAAGNTSILFPGFQVSTSGGAPGLLTQEATPTPVPPATPPATNTVTYVFTASQPGTHAYYSGTQGDLQVEMGLYGAIIVLPSSVPSACTTGLRYDNTQVKAAWHESDYRLAAAAYDHPGSCYDREYLFQWAEMDSRIHAQALAQVGDPVKVAACTVSPTTKGCSLEVQTEPYHPAYFLINGRSMPDLMDPNYAAEYPHQPYNGNPHTHPGELVLIRTIGQGRWQHPFHEHANHVRILARDGNLILSPTNPAQNLAGILMFNTDTTPGQAFDGIFYFTGRGLNWDPYGHHPGDTADPLGSASCVADANGYYTHTSGAAYGAINYYEWCQDHNKPLEVAPFGDVQTGGPATLPNANILTNGAWFNGSPYLGPDATLRGSAPACVGNPYGAAVGNPPNAGCTPLMPSNGQDNPAEERGWAFMWHSHNEREITTNNVFPGGMLMMLLVDSREFVIDESM
jgi:FtsP/CotA-like multicopper oxidase with cupredoxin domain